MGFHADLRRELCWGCWDLGIWRWAYVGVGGGGTLVLLLCVWGVLGNFSRVVGWVLV
jgi:hypothetical protein